MSTISPKMGFFAPRHGSIQWSPTRVPRASEDDVCLAVHSIVACAVMSNSEVGIDANYKRLGCVPCADLINGYSSISWTWQPLDEISYPRGINSLRVLAKVSPCIHEAVAMMGKYHITPSRNKN